MPKRVHRLKQKGHQINSMGGWVRLCLIPADEMGIFIGDGGDEAQGSHAALGFVAQTALPAAVGRIG